MMQNAKDTFYETMRARLVALNPDRVAMVRGALRPAILVEENEFDEMEAPLDCFRMRWTELTIEDDAARAQATLQCEFTYATQGSRESGGMNRGRSMAEMDAELHSMLNMPSRNTAKNNYEGVTTNQQAVELASRIWWDQGKFNLLNTQKEALERTVTVNVMSFREAGQA